MNTPKINVIYTHNGYFHTDEIFASAVLKIATLSSSAVVIRTRNKQTLKQAARDPATAVIDVGGVYSPSSLQFDHHQPGCKEFYSSKHADLGVFMSSAGMVYKEFGKFFFRNIANSKQELAARWSEAPDELKQFIIDRYYDIFVLPIDAGDNGISPHVPGIRISKFRIEKCRDKFSPLLLQTLVGSKNAVNVASSDQDRQFTKALRLVSEVVVDTAENHLRYHLDFKKNYDKLENTSIGDIVVLSEFFDYFSPLLKKEKEAGLAGVVKFIVLPRDKTKWQIHTVSQPGDKFARRADLISVDAARKKHSAPDDIEFVHSGKFIAVTKSKESAIELATLSLASHQKKNNLWWAKRAAAAVAGVAIAAKFLKVV
jgi:uncharacterized UPF0160 family protein